MGLQNKQTCEGHLDFAANSADIPSALSGPTDKLVGNGVFLSNRNITEVTGKLVVAEDNFGSVKYPSGLKGLIKKVRHSLKVGT